MESGGPSCLPALSTCPLVFCSLDEASYWEREAEARRQRWANRTHPFPHKSSLLETGWAGCREPRLTGKPVFHQPILCHGAPWSTTVAPEASLAFQRMRPCPGSAAGGMQSLWAIRLPDTSRSTCERQAWLYTRGWRSLVARTNLSLCPQQTKMENGSLGNLASSSTQARLPLLHLGGPRRGPQKEGDLLNGFGPAHFPWGTLLRLPPATNRNI